MNEYMSGTDLKQNLLRSEEFWIVVFALLIATTLAAHQDAYYAVFGVLGSYLYWIFRILIETAFFTAVLFAVEKYFSHLLPEWSRYATAVLLSLVPFTLAVTALDIIIGLPELGLNNYSQAPYSRVGAFGLELFYLLDNHIFLSLLLLIPRFLLQKGHLNDQVNTTTDGPAENTPPQRNFFDTLEPALKGDIYSMEAQEHYILISTSDTDRMVLHRFSDAVKQSPAALGMQVHRSHWVAHSAVKEVIIEGQSMKLKLSNDKEIPVSRTFRTTVEKQLKK